MSSGFLLGLAAIPTVVLVVALVWLGPSIISALVRRWSPAHWSLRGPQRRTADPSTLFRNVNAGGPRHLATFRRMFAVGPWTIYVARYGPGHNDQGDEPNLFAGAPGATTAVPAEWTDAEARLGYKRAP